MRPHPITFLITVLDPGGAERQMVELVTRLPRDQFEPSVVVLGPRPRREQLSDQVRAAGISLLFLNARSKWRARAATAELAEYLRGRRPVILQSFLHHANVIGAIAAHRAGVGHVVTGLRVAERRNGLRPWLERRTDKYVTYHVCVSQAVAQHAAGTIRLPASKLVIIPNGVDVQRLSAATPLRSEDLGVPQGSTILVFAGRLDRQKRIDWLLRRIGELLRRQSNIHLVLAGEGLQERRLRSLATRLAIGDHVHFVGWRADVASVLATADVLVLTSAWEGMPNVILEAMAAGKPVVATAAEGVAEVLGPLGDAPARQLVGSEDSAGFVDAVTALTDDPNLARKVGLANRLRAQQGFSLKRMVERYCELYRRLLYE